jgi:CelD/BcsL family acetyltransferase involved in cellulose biosynthesis
VFDSFSEACRIRDAWDELAEREGDLFCSFDYCALWWGNFGQRRQLEIHAYFAGDALVGLAPCFRERFLIGPLAVDVVRLIGSDHESGLCNMAISGEYAQTVLESLTDALLERRCDLMSFGPLPAYVRYADTLYELLRRKRQLQALRKIDERFPQALFELPSSPEAYLDGLSKRERHNIRKENRRLQREHKVRIEVAETDEEVEARFGEFVRMHQRQWQQKGHGGHFRDWPNSYRFHHDLAWIMARRDRLSLRKVAADGEPVCMEYAIRFGPRLHWLFSARSLNPRWHFCFPGRIGAFEMIVHAIDRGITEIDMGTGYYDYKLRLGAKMLPVTTVAAIQRRYESTVALVVLRLIALFHDVFGYHCWYTRLSEKLRVRSVQLHEHWIRTRIWPDDIHICAEVFRRARGRIGRWLPVERSRSESSGGE